MNNLTNEQQQQQDCLVKQWSKISKNKQIDLLITFLEEGFSDDDVFYSLFSEKSYSVNNENIDEFINKQLNQIEYPDFDKTIICLETPNSGHVYLYESTYLQLSESYDFEFMLPVLKAIQCIGADDKNKLIEEIRSQLLEQSVLESDTNSFSIFDDFKALTKSLINESFSRHTYRCGLLTAVTEFRPRNISDDDFAELMQLLCAHNLVSTFKLSNFQKHKIWVFENECKNHLIEHYTDNRIPEDDISSRSEEEWFEHISEYVDSNAEFEYDLSLHLGFEDVLCTVDGQNILFNCDKNNDIDYMRDIQKDIKDVVVKAIMSFNS
ncbi:MAG: hypothetical protein V7736_06655 [Colwellia polaris]